MSSDPLPRLDRVAVRMRCGFRLRPGHRFHGRATEIEADEAQSAGHAVARSHARTRHLGVEAHCTRRVGRDEFDVIDAPEHGTSSRDECTHRIEPAGTSATIARGNLPYATPMKPVTLLRENRARIAAPRLCGNRSGIPVSFRPDIRSIPSDPKG